MADLSEYKVAGSYLMHRVIKSRKDFCLVLSCLLFAMILLESQPYDVSSTTPSPEPRPRQQKEPH